MHGEPYSDAQAKWIRENVSLGIFRDKKHFLATFNAIFNDNRTFDAIVNYLAKNNLTLITKYNTPKFSEEQTAWLKSNYSKYDVFADFVRAYNDHFGTAWGYNNIMSHCRTLDLHEYSRSRRMQNAGQFKKGQKYGPEECPIGTIRYNKQRGVCFIKVQMCGGRSRDTSGHNLKEPFWRVLQDKVWEDERGTIPEGYMACPLNCNPYEDNINNIGLIDKRGKAIMGRKGWWTDNVKFTATAVRWCNLYFIAKDHGINMGE